MKRKFFILMLVCLICCSVQTRILASSNKKSASSLKNESIRNNSISDSSDIFGATKNLIDRDVASASNQKETVADMIGVKLTKVVKKEVDPFTLSYLGEFKLTAYEPSSKSCGKWGGSSVNKTTALGVGAYSKSTIAVDTSIIPYGTKVFIPGIGVRIATDCGGAIKGNKIDLYFDNYDDAINFGVHDYKVYVIKGNS